VVRGAYIGDAVGWASYFQNNPRRNYADAMETTRSDAISKICVKTLGIGSNPWNKRFASVWRKEHAIQVWVSKNGQKEKRWRRIDDDPLEGEEKSSTKAATAQTQPSPAAATPPEPPKPPAAQPSVGPAQAEKPAPRPSETQAAPTVPQKEVPGPAPKTTEQMVAENNIRLFMAEARKKKLITGNDAASAIAFLTDKCELPFDSKKFAGKTQIEIIRALLLGQTWRKFTDEILPKLRAIEV
jgi:genome maintenance protein MGM101